jgi:hypothetical protein
MSKLFGFSGKLSIISTTCFKFHVFTMNMFVGVCLKYLILRLFSWFGCRLDTYFWFLRWVSLVLGFGSLGQPFLGNSWIYRDSFVKFVVDQAGLLVSVMFLGYEFLE